MEHQVQGSGGDVVRPPARVPVIVYVTRVVQGCVGVLVFDHRDVAEAGTQVPVGGVHSGERVDRAGLREVREEPGLQYIHDGPADLSCSRASPRTHHRATDASGKPFLRLPNRGIAPGEWLMQAAVSGIRALHRGRSPAASVVAVSVQSTRRSGWRSIVTATRPSAARSRVRAALAEHPQTTRTVCRPAATLAPALLSEPQQDSGWLR